MRLALDRARTLLRRPGAWIEGEAGGPPYHLRIGADRRARVTLVLDEAAFTALIADPGLRTRPGGGWIARPSAPEQTPAPEPGRPGRIEGSRDIIGEDG
ncbi:MAG: hypothetical protein JWR59_269, partial [Brevundimonas sp.]|nr:hypothetical protein [Brevundimonas sp.]